MELTGKTVLITGGTAGLGKTTVSTLASKGPKTILLSGRNEERGQAVVNEVKEQYPDSNVRFLAIDLASFASIREASAALRSDKEIPHVDVLILNAGIMKVPPALTADGYEIQFGTNFLGHALLVQELMPLLQPSPDRSRVIFVASTAFHLAATIDFPTLKTPQTNLSYMGAGWRRYGQSKLAQLLYARQFAEKHPEIEICCLHPGIIATDLLSTLSYADQALVYTTNIGKMSTAEEGVRNSVWAATADHGDGEGQLKSGVYYEPVGKPGYLKGQASRDDVLGARLWEWTLAELK